jgi:hypothetical protein
MKDNIRKGIITLDCDAQLLRRLTYVRRILVSCGAYSTKNMESQDLKFVNLNVPEWEKDIIRDSWDATKKISHSLFKELEKLNKTILKDGDDK